MQFIDLKKQYERIKEKVDTGIHAVLEHGRYIMGPEIELLEKKLAEYAGVKHCVVCSSGTDALLMPLMAYGIGSGDAVFTTPFTFVATAEVIGLVGATPVFVDIDPVTFNIDPVMLEFAIKKIENEGKFKLKAIIPVDLFGHPADYFEIEDIAERHDLIVLEDAAQGFGSNIKGLKAGSFGNAAATSFFPAKPLGCYGDGGAVFTNDTELYEKLVSIRVHGQGKDRYENVRLGINGRMDSIQAAVLIAKLEIFDDELSRRNSIASYYYQLLSERLKTPEVMNGYFSSWAQYSVLAKNESERQKIQEALKTTGVPTAIYYPIPLHLQKAYTYLDYKEGDFPVSERCSKQIFSLPMHPYLTNEEIEMIAKVIVGA